MASQPLIILNVFDDTLAHPDIHLSGIQQLCQSPSQHARVLRSLQGRLGFCFETEQGPAGTRPAVRRWFRQAMAMVPPLLYFPVDPHLAPMLAAILPNLSLVWDADAGYCHLKGKAEAVFADLLPHLQATASFMRDLQFDERAIGSRIRLIGNSLSCSDADIRSWIDLCAE